MGPILVVHGYLGKSVALEEKRSTDSEESWNSNSLRLVGNICVGL